ncbi:unnamed protein product [Moneuplotes crassus]|uniref:Protein root UVB sensitive/RUS domain-containing protein n=1 Tax=Euplotes crassus TaxID=5936 RepID=A0AAD1U8V6_EUPCR|nr:unnamed protein product [Moneuplotes crassus]
MIQYGGLRSKLAKVRVCRRFGANKLGIESTEIHQGMWNWKNSVFSQHNRGFHSFNQLKIRNAHSNSNSRELVCLQRRYKITEQVGELDTNISQSSFNNTEDDKPNSPPQKNSPNGQINITNYSKLSEPDHSNIVLDSNNKVKEYNPVKKHFIFSTKEMQENFAYYFLPNGYPHSVNKGYAKFAIYSSLSATAITILNFISTQALFVALGSTTTQASLYSAAYIWVLKDGIGQLGGILFAGKYGKSFDEDVKKWRFMCMILFNISIIVEMITLRFPGAFIYLASLANMGKNVTFLCAAATRASINLRFAKKSNIGDIAGKGVTQFTTSSLVGMGVGLVISKACNISSIYTIAPLFASLTLLNIVCSYKATRVLDESNFNKQRFYILFEEYMKSGKILDVKEVNKREAFWIPSLFNPQNEFVTNFGVFSLAKQINFLKKNNRHSTADSLIDQAKNNERKFLYYVHWPRYRKTILPRRWSHKREYKINFNLHKDASNKQILKAYFFGLKLDEILDKKLEERLPKNARKPYHSLTDEELEIRSSCLRNAIFEAEEYFELFDFEDFFNKMQNFSDPDKENWDLNSLYIDKGTNRYTIE